MASHCGKSSIGLLQKRWTKLFLFVVGRKYTCAREVAAELGICDDQARTWLKSFTSGGIPITTTQSGNTTYYSVDTTWRKKHGFLE